MAGFWEGRRVFVTGATGIVGSWLTKELLARRARVVALVRDADPQSELFRSGDVLKVHVVNGPLESFRTLERALSEHAIDTVFHLAAQAIVTTAQRSPLATFEANVRGTYNLLEACRLHAGLVQRVVVASSDKAYGEHPTLPYTEDMPLNGRHPYEVSKSCADLIAQSYYHSFGLPVAITRFGNVYGGGDLNWSRIVPGTIRSLLRAERPIIRSDGTYVRDYLYVKDVVHAYLWMSERLGDAAVTGQAFNFGTESRITVLELVRRIQRLLGYDHLEPDIRGTATGEIRCQVLSTAKATRLLGWRPQYTMDQGLSETIVWYRDFLEDRGT